MLNPFREVNWHPSPAEKRTFGWSLVLGFPSAAAVLSLADRLWSGAWHATPFLWLGACGLALGALLVAIPLLATPFYFLWHLLTCCMGAVVGNGLLAFFYMFIVTPVGCAMRACGRQALPKAFDRNARTYWQDFKKADDIQDYYRQF
jgi:hypothetical protein